jgi:diaminobutyrate-2-oxoglutarate transaminase
VNTKSQETDVFNRMESEVRSYCRAFPSVFSSAEGSIVRDQRGERYLDFFAGAGVLNYGHNNPLLKNRLLSYIESNGIAHGLDMSTEAKAEFLKALEERILKPRHLDYCVMFPGPTGTNAVESALKIARKATGRTNVIAFTNGFHGMTLGSLAATGNAAKRDGASIPLGGVSRMPFDGYFGPDVDTAEYLDKMLADTSSGIDAPAAILVETVQAEGGVNVASASWLRDLQRIARANDCLLIVDDIQAGCGRTGSFFSFERAGIEPDIVCLSKSLSGFGLPLAVTLLRREIDCFAPGEHNGTFRGNNHAFVTARAAIEAYWQDAAFEAEIKEKSALMIDLLEPLAEEFDGELRGRGLMLGIAFEDTALAQRISRRAFENKLIIETSGAVDEVLKFLPPLTASAEELRDGVQIVLRSLEAETRTPSRGGAHDSIRTNA